MSIAHLSVELSGLSNNFHSQNINYSSRGVIGTFFLNVLGHNRPYTKNFKYTTTMPLYYYAIRVIGGPLFCPKIHQYDN